MHVGVLGTQQPSNRTVIDLLNCGFNRSPELQASAFDESMSPRHEDRREIVAAMRCVARQGHAQKMKQPQLGGCFIAVQTGQLDEQTLTDFMPVSASTRVLYIPLPTTVVSVVVGFLSTIVHFLVFTSCTT